MSELPSARARRGTADLRPGSMTAAMRAASASAGPSWLRWAIVRDARIVREARLAPEQMLSVGGDADVPCREMRDARPIAYARDGRWHLRLDPRWEARTSEGRVVERAPDEDGLIDLPLEDGARVRVALGDVSLLVQVIDRPPARTAPPLPPALRGGLLARADWAFTAFVVGSSLLHFAFVVLVLEADWPVQRELIPPIIAQIIFISDDPPDDAPADRMVADATDDPEDASHGDPDEPTDEPTGPTPPGPQHARRGSARGDAQPSLEADEEARHAVAAAHLMLGAALGGEGTALRRLIDDGGPMASSYDVLAAAASPTIASIDANGLQERDGSAPCTSCDGGEGIGALRPRPRGNGPIGEAPPVEERVVEVIDCARSRGRCEFGPEIDDPPPDFNPDELYRALRARMPAIQRCYEHELTQGNPDTEGRITIALRVMPVGSIEAVRAAENETGSQALAACTIRNVRTVRMRVGPEEPVEVRYPIVFRRPE